MDYSKVFYLNVNSLIIRTLNIKSNVSPIELIKVTSIGRQCRNALPFLFANEIDIFLKKFYIIRIMNYFANSCTIDRKSVV